MAATTTTTSRMAIKTPQPSANLFMIIMSNCESSFFQDRTDLRGNDLPLTALIQKCVGPHVSSAEKIFVSLACLDDALAHDDSSVPIQTNVKIVNLKLGENDVASHAFRSPRLFTILPSGKTIVQSSVSMRRVYELSPLTRASAHSC